MDEATERYREQSEEEVRWKKGHFHFCFERKRLQIQERKTANRGIRMQNMARETSFGQEEGSSSTPVAKVGSSGQQHQASP